jgi:hypothetical protein
MKKMILASLLALLSVSSFAAEGDLVLPGARWYGNFKNYICAAFGPSVAQPSTHSDFKVTFEKITTDYTLDNGLITATFEEDGALCRYSALVFADNDASTIILVNSKAFAPAGDSNCAEGKAVLDSNFETLNPYLYYGHPHNLAIMAPIAGAETICGAGATAVGVNFVMGGLIR